MITVFQKRLSISLLIFGYLMAVFIFWAQLPILSVVYMTILSGMGLWTTISIINHVVNSADLNRVSSEQTNNVRQMWVSAMMVFATLTIINVGFLVSALFIPLDWYVAPIAEIGGGILLVLMYTIYGSNVTKQIQRSR
jgi:hypothetical protein